MGIRYVGETVSKKLTQYFKTIDALMVADFETLKAVNEIGERIAKSVIDFFSLEQNITEVKRLKEAGLCFKAVVKEMDSNKLQGAKIVVSGVFTLYNRKQLKQLIEDNGGVNISSISKNTNYVLAGENMGPAKLEKAQTLGINIISEQDFAQMIA